MNCPIDGTTLQMTDRQGIEVDYCPKCRGVWLDRGELDKIIERSARPYSTNDDDDDDYRPSSGQYREQSRESYPQDDRSYQGQPPVKKKKRSLLEDLFDFG